MAWPWGSMSTSNTLRRSRARNAERLMDVMLFPHPPFWFTTAIVRIHAPSSSVSFVGRLESTPFDATVAAVLAERQLLFVVVTPRSAIYGGPAERSAAGPGARRAFTDAAIR